MLQNIAISVLSILIGHLVTVKYYEHRANSVKKIANKIIDVFVDENIEDVNLLAKKLKPIMPKITTIYLFAGLMTNIGSVNEEKIEEFLLSEPELQVIKE